MHRYTHKHTHTHTASRPGPGPVLTDLRSDGAEHLRRALLPAAAAAAASAAASATPLAVAGAAAAAARTIGRKVAVVATAIPLSDTTALALPSCLMQV